MFGGAVLPSSLSGVEFSIPTIRSLARGSPHPHNCLFCRSYPALPPLLRKAFFVTFWPQLVIPRHWKSPQPPTIVEWLQELGFIHSMEELVANNSADLGKMNTAWAPWGTYLSSQEWQDLLLK
ncbi:hypothetical protein GDO81_016912 [Engystomops pustulosus]|uniref:SAM domain-containing protein n=1 Tax=Engystomops pustulosus TaxID=76066 RepID=A0AAV7AA30_ENGPU|nr:hypothetical protein GDO81_016912 [Engystomops pustulosus]